AHLGWVEVQLLGDLVHLNFLRPACLWREIGDGQQSQQLTCTRRPLSWMLVVDRCPPNSER
ncbi:MAG: hypothetical protein VB875_18630, partial [Pirellulales bacterium]